MKRKYYAAQNAYGNESSMGFANTWHVYVFADKASRDRFVRCSSNISTQAIKKRDIGKYLERPEPFSGRAYMIDPCHSSVDKGMIGEVVVGWSDQKELIRLY